MNYFVNTTVKHNFVFMTKKDNLISLDLTNVSSADSNINLFSFSSGGSTTSLTDTYQSVSMVFVAGVQYQITGFNGVIFNNYFTAPVIATIGALMTDLNTGGLSAFAVFSYEANPSAPNYKIFAKIINPNFTFTNFSSLTPTVTTLFGAKYYTLQNSTVVPTAIEGFTYTELMNELQQQPCILNSVDVYASSIGQASLRWYKTLKETSGFSIVNVDSPKIDPMQVQFAITGIDLKFITSPLNVLQYSVKGNETVRLIFYFTEIDQSDKMIEETVEPKKIKPIEMIKVKQSINPVFDLLGITIEKKITIKQKIESKVDKGDVTDEEIYNSFDGLDYTEM